MDTKILEDIGLKKNEIKVYLGLLKLGQSTASKISEDISIHRPTVYDALDQLIRKGIVSYIFKGETKYFEAADPQRLLDILKDKERRLEKIMPELLIAKELQKAAGTVKVYEGVGAFRSLLDQFLEKGEDIYVYGIPAGAPLSLGGFRDEFHSIRKKENIVMHHIYDYGAKDSCSMWNDDPLTPSRYFPKGFGSPVSTNICGDEVILVHWTTPGLIIRIINKDIAESHKKYFKMLWDFSLIA